KAISVNSDIAHKSPPTLFDKDPEFLYFGNPAAVPTATSHYFLEQLLPKVDYFLRTPKLFPEHPP
ncbi:hypothetical protein, partial [Lapidilactobacillus mulanensis]|uniref:hypothetical protein n=1 Tax=Lapidilactobacillus mulanensis TaxID=2485999 RepID=UPI001CDC3094